MMVINDITLTWDDIGVHILIASITGIIVSFVFLRFILFFLRPKITISSEIAIEQDNDGEDWYWFKIVNHSRYEGFELKFSAESLSYEPATDGCHHLRHDRRIELNRSVFNSIPKYISNKAIKKRKSSAPHCFQVRTKENIANILKNKKQSIILHVSLKHGLSGIPRSFEQSFTHQSIVKRGSFAFGNQTNVV